MIKEIASKENKKIKYAKLLRKKSFRIKENSFLLEGKKVFFEALESNVDIQSIFVRRDFNIDLIKGIETDIFLLDDKIFKEITEMENSEGILAVCTIPDYDDIDVSDNIIVLDNIRDPGNMGTIIRTAESFGYDNIYLLNDCVDIYNKKVIRGSMGSLFRTNIRAVTIEEVLDLKNTHKIYSMALEENSVSIYNMTEWEKHAIIIGNEANGISKEIIELSDQKIIIPLCGKVESLNAGVAASVTMFYFNQLKTMKEKKTDSN